MNQPGDQPSINARLGPLQANGGASGTEPLTHMPLPGSPLIDAALLSGCPALDQLGRSRPDGPGCDVGAVETTPEITPVITWHLFLPLIQR